MPLPSSTESELVVTEYVGDRDVSFTVTTGDVTNIGPTVSSASMLMQKLELPSVLWLANNGRVMVAVPLDIVKLPRFTESVNRAELVQVPDVVQYRVNPCGTFVVFNVKDTDAPSLTDDVLADIVNPGTATSGGGGKATACPIVMYGIVVLILGVQTPLVFLYIVLIGFQLALRLTQTFGIADQQPFILSNTANVLWNTNTM